MRIRLIVTYIFIYLSIILLSCASKDKWVPNLPEDIGAAGDGKLEYVLEYIRDSYHLPSLGAMLILGGQIFEPLGMYSTGFGAPGTPGKIDEPWGHIMGEFYSPIEPRVYADLPPVIRPAGLIHSTLGDYAKFIAEHLAGARGLDGLISAP